MPQTRTLAAPTGFIPSAPKHIRSGMGILLEYRGSSHNSLNFVRVLEGA